MKFLTAAKFAVVYIAGCALALVAAPFARAQSATPPPQQSAASGESAAHPTAAALAPELKSRPPATGVPSGKYIQVPTGTRLPLVLHNAISTRSARAGDSVYLETLFPILIDERIVIPAGSYVSGEVTETKRPGRVRGRGEIAIKLDNLILPNGYEAQFNAVPTDAGTGGNETVGREGTVRGDSNKAGDANTVAQDTVIGAGLGGIAGRDLPGVGAGAGIGAAAGLATILLTRGPEAELPRGSTLDVVLNRPLYLLSAKINFTSPGQASTLAGPPNREHPREGIIPH